MTNVTISFDNAEMARTFAARFVKTDGICDVWIDDNTDRIATLPRTEKECLASIRRAEKDIRDGRVHTLKTARERFPRV